MAMQIRFWQANSTVSGGELVNSRAYGPCRKQILPELGLQQPP